VTGRNGGAIAVSLHDVEPATFERCALIRDWLNDHGVDRVTLLVIPAPDLHPFHDRRPDLAEWLDECSRAGDAVAQHGFQHRASGGARPPRPRSRWAPPRHSSAGSRRASSGPAPASAATSCASTSTRPTLTTRATSAQWRRSCVAPVAPRGDL
jgi:hypothetical protein